MRLSTIGKAFGMKLTRRERRLHNDDKRTFASSDVDDSVEMSTLDLVCKYR